jgi:hypothetical protein
VERKAYEKKRKEIERQRQVKLYTIKKSAEEMGQAAELDNVNLLDIFDSSYGLYSFGGSLTEISLMLVAFESYNTSHKLEIDINKDYVIQFIKNVLTFNGKSDQLLHTPALERSKVLELFSSESPLELIKEAYGRESGEDEGDALVDKLADLLAQTSSLKL